MADTERERIRLALEKIIKAAGPHGLTLTEINRKTRRMFDKRDRDEARIFAEYAKRLTLAGDAK